MRMEQIEYLMSKSGHQILFVSGRVLKQCYLHNNMDADCKCMNYGYYVVITVNYCTLDIGLLINIIIISVP